ncbi:E3 ubiquitin-protein ligase ATL4 [Linum perenne]
MSSSSSSPLSLSSSSSTHIAYIPHLPLPPSKPLSSFATTSRCRFWSPLLFLDSLPLFIFRSINHNNSDSDTVVCLSKFDPLDQLRLLPLCCHAFHVGCIGAWLLPNQTCPPSLAYCRLIFQYPRGSRVLFVRHRNWPL